MNIHHLELFYFVARHGGISAAVRLMPYGIQQPAVSSQILALEENLGVRLFQRQPFRLTAEGQDLLAFIRPFFDNLDAVGVWLRKRLAPQLRIGASEIVLRPKNQRGQADMRNFGLGLNGCSSLVGEEVWRGSFASNIPGRSIT